MPNYEEHRGLRFFFYSHEEDRAHVHVESQDGIAKFWLEPEVELIRNRGLKPKDLKRAYKRIQEMREEYLAKWEERLDRES